jgi:RHS repeat-associated protein
LITDSTGAVIGTSDHLPFGEDAGTTGVTEKHRFTNYERDAETGGDYAVNRLLVGSSARFAQADLLFGRAGISQSLHRYSYAANDPLDLDDPLGLAPGLACQLDGFDYPCELAMQFVDSDAAYIQSVSMDGQTYSTYIDRQKKDFWRWTPRPDLPDATGEYLLGDLWFDHAAYDAAVRAKTDSLLGAAGWPPRRPFWDHGGERWYERYTPPARPRFDLPRDFGRPTKIFENTRFPWNPNKYPGFDPARPMVPQNASFWLRVRIITAQLGRIVTGVLKGMGDSLDLVIMVRIPSERDMRRIREGQMY